MRSDYGLAQDEKFTVLSSGCWMWLGKKLHGYGLIRWEPDKHKVRVHRLSWAMQWGEWPDAETDIHHKCHRKACFNPAHLTALRKGHHAAEHGWKRDMPIKDYFANWK